MTAAPRPTRIGSVLHDYRLLHQLGAGPSGEVFIARDEAHHLDVALKLFDPARCAPDGVARYAEQARAAAAIPHTGAPRVLKVVADATEPYVALELIRSLNLAYQLRERGPLAWDVARALFARVAAALHAAHAGGVVHGHLKPTNIHSDDDRVRIVDYGAAALAPGGDTGQTRVHEAQAVDYLAPEQIRGEPPGPRSDVYSLGVLLFEAVTGQRPFAGRMQEVVRHHLFTPPPAPRLLAPSLPPEAEDQILALLVKQVNARPDAAEVARRLSADVDTRVTPRRPAAETRVNPRQRPADAHEPDEHPTSMWIRGTHPRPATTSETVVLPLPPPPPPDGVTLLTPGMQGDFLIDSPPPQTEDTTGQQPSATVFVDRARLASLETTAAPTRPLPRWRRWLAGPWPLERRLIALNVAFGVCLVLALLTLAFGD